METELKRKQRKKNQVKESLKENKMNYNFFKDRKNGIIVLGFLLLLQELDSRVSIEMVPSVNLPIFGL